MRVRVVMTEAAQQFVTPLAAGALAGERVFTDLFDPRQRVRRRPHPAGARGRADRGGAGDRRSDGADGARPGRRSRHRRAAGDARAHPDRAGDEPGDVGASRDAAQSRDADRRRRARGRAERRRDGGERTKPGSAAWRSRSRSRRRRWRCCRRERGALAGKRVLVTSGPTHEPIDPVRYIANRSSGKQGHAIAAAAAAAGAQVTLVSGPVNDPRSAGRDAWSGSRPRATCCARSRRRCRPTSRCSPPRWRTGEQRRSRGRRSRRAARSTPELALRREPGHPGDDGAAQARGGRSW